MSPEILKNPFVRITAILVAVELALVVINPKVAVPMALPIGIGLMINFIWWGLTRQETD